MPGTTTPGPIALERLLERLRRDREAGRTIVFTNGCFDGLHPGHHHLLERAASFGDVLVVALNTDASVRRLKGPGRPATTFADRVAALVALDVVDHVVGFDDDTPLAVIRSIVPDVLVKGGDWAIDRIVGREVVEGADGRVVRIPRIPGHSTTARLDRATDGSRGDDA